MKKVILAVLAAVALSGCANFKAVSEFAEQTTRVTGVVRTEFTQFDAICREQAELSIVVGGIADEGPLKDCKAYKAAHGRLAEVTLDVLDDYARALKGLADDRAFDLSSSIDSVGSKLKGLKDRGGRPIVDGAEVTALTKLVSLLADIATQRRREAAVQRLVEQKDELATTGRILRSFFVRDPSAPPGRAQAPYANLVGLTSDALNSSEVDLNTEAFRKAEPIRTAELLRGLRTRKALLAARTGTSPDKLPVAIAAAIDAWLAALDSFATDALKPDAKQLFERLKELRSKAQDAKEALQAAQD